MDTTNPETATDAGIRRRLAIASRGTVPVFDGTSVMGLLELGYSVEELHRFVAHHQTLRQRIDSGEPLTVNENDSALRLVRVMDMAERVFGEPEKARRWLRKANRGLDGVVPLDLLDSESGAHIVEETLQQIDHGIYA